MTSLQKKNLVEKVQLFQDQFVNKRKQRKNEKEQHYREFLADPGRPLPPFETLVKWRNWCFIIGILFLIEPVIQMFFFWMSCFDAQICLHIYFEMAFFCTWAFGATFDWCIYRRWGNKKSVIRW